ncbi:MAG: hypothetical protein ACFCUT_06740 [Kiloniellaceae bacterium]
MADRIDLLLEAERRGILPQEQKALLGEARRRGLVPGPRDLLEGIKIPRGSAEERQIRQLQIRQLQARQRLGREALASSHHGPRDLLAGAPPQPASGGAVAARPAVGSDQALFGGRSDATLSEGWKALDDTMRSVASGMTFGFADELAAGASSLTGVGGQPGGQGDYSSNLAAERARDKAIPPEIAIPGQIAGAVATGTGLGRAGLTLLNAAKPTAASMAARGAAEGAAYGAAHGAGAAEGGAQERAEGAAWGAFLGALTGGGIGAVGGRVAQAGKPATPTVEALKGQAGRAYDTALNSGVTLTGNRYAAIADDLASVAQKEGFHPRIHPKVSAALDEFSNLKGHTPTLQQVDNLRRILKQAGGSLEKAERRLAQQLISKLDDTLDTLTPGDVIAGNVKEATEALRSARSLWSRASKGETIDGLIARAHDRTAQFSGSGMENALRTEFRQLAMNPKKMRLFSKAEQDAIKRVSQGEPLTNVLRMIGKFAPTGVVSSVLSGGAGYGIAGPVGAVALPAIGFAGRAGATALTQRAANAASEIARAGGGGVPQAAPLSHGQVNALRAFMLAPIQQEVNAMNRLRQPNTAR